MWWLTGKTTRIGPVVPGVIAHSHFLTLGKHQSTTASFKTAVPCLSASSTSWCLEKQPQTASPLQDLGNLAGDHELACYNYKILHNSAQLPGNIPGDLSQILGPPPFLPGLACFGMCYTSVNTCRISSKRWPISKPGEVIPAYERGSKESQNSLAWKESRDRYIIHDF